MRFTAVDERGEAVLIAFALESYDRGQTLFFELFSFREGLKPGDYTLDNGKERVRIVLPEKATRKPLPDHLVGQDVRKAP